MFTGVGYNVENEFGSGLVDVATGKERVRFKEHTNTVLHGSVSRDGKLAVTTVAMTTRLSSGVPPTAA